jgi:hypothetical protein
MRGKKFNISHSILGIAAILLLQILIVSFIPALAGISILAGAIVCGIGIVVIATDVVEEVRESRKMLILLSVTVLEFIVFYAFQYYLILQVEPGSFQNLIQEPVTLLLQSAMVFALNPLYLPINITGKALLLINTLESLALGLFVLQNIWQLHRFRA